MPFIRDNINNHQCIIGSVYVVDASDTGSEIKLKFPHDPDHSYRALIDTGAMFSCISTRIEDRLSLIARGKGFYSSASHENVPANFHKVHIGLPAIVENKEVVRQGEKGVESVIEVKLFRGIRVMSLPIKQQDNYDVIIGMDFIVQRSCTLHLVSNFYTFTF